MPHLGQKLKEPIIVLLIALGLPKSVTMEEGYKVSKLDTGTKSHLVAISTLGVRRKMMLICKIVLRHI